METKFSRDFAILRRNCNLKCDERAEKICKKLLEDRGGDSGAVSE